MDSRTGKKIRLGRLLGAGDPRAVVVAASHGVQSGPPARMGDLKQIKSVLAALRAADAVMVAPGMVTMVEDHYVGREAPALVVHMDWKNSTRKLYPPHHDGRGEAVVAALAQVQEVADAGATAIMTYLHVGQLDTALEREEIARNARLVNDCARHGIVCVIEPRSAREHADRAHANSPEVLSFYCRMAAEIGADVVKCVWPGSPEGFAEVTQTCPVPILLAGGPGGDDLPGTLRLAQEAMTAGAAGVMFGRRITAAADPAAVVAGLRAVVHDGLSAAEAMKQVTFP